MVNIKQITYNDFGNCIEISNETVKVIVTVDFGPRIINYSFLNGENILFENPDRSFNESASKEKYGSPWYIYGGHRMWTSPERFDRCYYPDNEKVDYEILPNGVHFIQRYHKVCEIQCEFTVTMADACSDVKIEHKLTNHSKNDLDAAIWGITALSSGGMEIVPQPTTDTVFDPNRKIVFWSYVKIADERAKWGERYLALSQKDSDRNYKIGINAEHNFAMYLNHGDLFVKKFDLVKGGTYPDGGVSFETYTNKMFLEMESLGEYKTLKQGESSFHSEYWSLHKCDVQKEFDEDAFDLLVKKYVK